MANLTDGELKLIIPSVSDDIKQTIGVDLGNNFTRIDDNVSKINSNITNLKGDITVSNTKLDDKIDTVDSNIKTNLDKINLVETDVKDSQDKISILSTKVNPETPLNTTSQNLSGAINEVKGDLVAHKEKYTTQRQQDQLKIATVEKGLNDYKSTIASVNVNQEAKQKVTGYGTISLPKITANGQANISLKGNTITDETGTKSTVSAIRLKSVGKNLFDGKVEKYKRINSSGVIEFYPSTDITNYIKVKPNTKYSFNPEHHTKALYDANKKLIQPLTGRVITTTNETYYIRATQANDWAEYQINEGEVATPYEPYTESTQYIQAKDSQGKIIELRSLQNDTKDEVRVSGNKAEKVQRVKESNDLNLFLTGWSMTSSDINTIYFQRPNIISDLDSTKPQSLNIGLNNFKYVGNINIDEECFQFVPSSIRLKINKSRLSTLDVNGLVNWITSQGSLTLTYQLAEPIITPIQTSGNLVSYPSGTVYVENVVADAGIYTTKFDIKELQLPIKSIDKLIKYNFTTGVQTVLDASLAVINADKKSFTHPNLVKGDMVFVDYFYDVESTLGETTIEYYDSRYTIKDTTNDKFYSWDIESTNGVPTVNLTEVL